MARVRTASVIFEDLSGRVRLLLRDKHVPCPDMWGLIGGIIEDGEDPIMTAISGAREKTGYNQDGLRFYRAFRLPSIQYNIFYVRKHFEPEHFRTENTEGQDQRWFSKQELEDIPIIPSVKMILLDYFKNRTP